MVSNINTVLTSCNQCSHLVLKEQTMKYPENDDSSAPNITEESDDSPKSNIFSYNSPPTSSCIMTVNDSSTNVNVSLLDGNIWSQFNQATNEMIVTRDGRRMFPVIKFRISGLESNEMYKLLLDFKLVDHYRWKYINGEWVRGSRAEIPSVSKSYTHPDSPNYGKFFMESIVAFSRTKITNKDDSDMNKIFLNSMHKYIPRVHILKISTDKKTDTKVGTYTFPETEFIAVTAYQNDNVTNLKVKFNPFAKAFLEPRENCDSNYPYRDNQISRNCCTYINNMYHPNDSFAVESAKMYKSVPNMYNHNVNNGPKGSLALSPSLSSSAYALDTINCNFAQNGLLQKQNPRYPPYYNNYINTHAPVYNGYNFGMNNGSFPNYYNSNVQYLDPFPYNGPNNGQPWVPINYYHQTRPPNKMENCYTSPDTSNVDDKNNNPSCSLKALADLASEQPAPSIKKTFNKNDVSNIKNSNDNK